MNQICVNKVNHYHIVLSSCSNHKISSSRQLNFEFYPNPMDSGQNLGVPDYQVSVANFKINHIIPALLEFLKT